MARSTVLAYNPDLIDESELPDSILDLAEPEWKGRITFAPAGADFQAIVAAILEIEGEDATRAWLEGIKDLPAVGVADVQAGEMVSLATSIRLKTEVAGTVLSAPAG